VECNLPFDVSYKKKCDDCLYQVRTTYSCVNETAVIREETAGKRSCPCAFAWDKNYPALE